MWLCELVLSIAEMRTEKFLAADHPPSKGL